MSATEWKPGFLPSYRSPGAWGIEPVSWEHRRLGFRHYAYLWGGLGVGLPGLVTGGTVLAAFVFRDALLAILIGGVLGAVLLAGIGLAGSDTGVPTMVLLRPALGVRGSYIPALLSALHLVARATFGIVAMARAADAATQRLSGESAGLFWVLFLGVLSSALALAGPVVVVRLWQEKFAFWCLLATIGWVTYLAQEGVDGGAIWGRPSHEGIPFWRAVDLVVAVPVAWLPLAADYNRFAEGGRRALGGTVLGNLAGTFTCIGLGGLLFLSGGVPGDPLGRILFLAGTGVTLLLILVGETDQAFAQIYSGALATQNLFPRLRQRWMAAGVGFACIALAATLPVSPYEAYLVTIGSLFVPLAGVFLADYYWVARRWYEVEELFRRHGRYWFTGGFCGQGFAAWGVGIATYYAFHHWAPTLSASLPAIAAAFGAHVLLAGRGRAAMGRGAEGGAA